MRPGTGNWCKYLYESDLQEEGFATRPLNEFKLPMCVQPRGSGHLPQLLVVSDQCLGRAASVVWDLRNIAFRPWPRVQQPGLQEQKGISTGSI